MSDNTSKIDVTYDWISATFDRDSGFYIPKVLPLGDRVKKPKGKAQHGYDSFAQYESGAKIMWHSKREEMGYHLILSGSALIELRKSGMDCIEVIGKIKHLNGRTSRVDIAIDAHNLLLDPERLAKEEREEYNGRGRTPKYTLVGDMEDGWTIYIGSRASERFLRIYDKAKEQKDFKSDHVRIEIECKGMTAHWLGSELANKTAHEAYVIASTMIRTMVDFKDKGWKTALSAETVELSIPKKTDRDTLHWLVKSCAPALARVISEKPNQDVMGEFWNALTEELSKRGLAIE